MSIKTFAAPMGLVGGVLDIFLFLGYLSSLQLRIFFSTRFNFLNNLLYLFLQVVWQVHEF